MNFVDINIFRPMLVAGMFALIMVNVGCASGRREALLPPEVEYPDSWERLVPLSAVVPGELEEGQSARLSSPGTTATGSCVVGDAPLGLLLDVAVDQNLTIKNLRSQVAEAWSGVVVARADRLPSLGASFSASRQKSASGSGTQTGNRFGLSTDAQFEVDVWGKLSDVQRRAQLTYRAAQFRYEDTRRIVLENVSKAWYTAILARELVTVFEQRVESVRNNLEIIEQGYRQGINSALDVYLARTSFAQEQSRLARQRQTELESIGALQLLLAEYPGGDKLIDSKLPGLATEDFAHIPQKLLAHRPDVQAAWTRLLAQDAAVAIAHKQRYPRLVLSAGLNDLDQQIGDIIDGDNILWSALAGVTQPVFQAGRLKALEAQAREQLEQNELDYIATLQSAFGEVENALSDRRSLRLQLQSSERAAEAANAAYELSFQQYQRGLVSYTTVLQSEQRAFDTTSNLLDLRYRQLVNRVELCTALGGEGESQ